MLTEITTSLAVQVMQMAQCTKAECHNESAKRDWDHRHIAVKGVMSTRKRIIKVLPFLHTANQHMVIASMVHKSTMITRHKISRLAAMLILPVFRAVFEYVVIANSARKVKRVGYKVLLGH